MGFRYAQQADYVRFVRRLPKPDPTNDSLLPTSPVPARPLLGLGEDFRKEHLRWVLVAIFETGCRECCLEGVLPLGNSARCLCEGTLVPVAIQRGSVV